MCPTDVIVGDKVRGKRSCGPRATCEEDGEGHAWREVRKHNTAKNLWVVLHGRVYGITKWVDRHPGGREQLLLYAGRDTTYPFISHYPFTDTANKLL